MKNRPFSITFIAGLFFVVGFMATSASLFSLWVETKSGTLELTTSETAERILQVCINASAVIGGIFLLRGAVNWARWLLVAWMVFHFGLSFFHSLFEVLFHTALFIPITLLLFRSRANAFFSGRSRFDDRPDHDTDVA